MNQIIEVVGALICQNGLYLVGRRPLEKSQGGKWEFIGGKIEPGESPEAALARECREELDLEITNEKIIDSVVHAYPDKTIHLTLLSCAPKPGSVPRPLEHAELRWTNPAEFPSMDFADADKEFIQKLFENSFSSPQQETK